MTVDELLAKQTIRDLCGAYMRGLDRLDMELLRSAFFEDATTDYGAFSGGRDDFVEFAHKALVDHAANHHMIGQTNIDVDGDVAFGEIYFQAYHRVTQNGEPRDVFISGRYVDRYERRDGEWRIAHRTELNDWVRNDPASDGPYAKTLRGARGAADLSSRRDEVRRR